VNFIVSKQYIYF